MSRKLDWVGIGAQRCGTTWFTDMLTSHPEVGLVGQRKELHRWDAGLLFEPPEPPTPAQSEPFVGEFTPAYLRMPWSIDSVVDSLTTEAPVFVLLRDPVDRFRSAMDLYLDRARPPDDPTQRARWVRLRGTDALWAGFYWRQLDLWLRAGLSPFVIIYEDLRRDPQAVMESAWATLGLEPVPVRVAPSSTSAPKSFQFPAGLEDRLVRLYGPDVDALEDAGFVQPGDWRHFA